MERDFFKDKLIKDRLMEVHDQAIAELKNKLQKEEAECKKFESETFVLKQEIKKQTETRMREIEQSTAEQRKALEERDQRVQGKQIELDRIEREKERLKHELDQKERLLNNNKLEHEDLLNRLKEANGKILV